MWAENFTRACFLLILLFDLAGQLVNPFCCRFATRLTGIKENKKFQKTDQSNEQVSGLKLVVDEAKKRHNVK